jgi:hypothetical protein
MLGFVGYSASYISKPAKLADHNNQASVVFDLQPSNTFFKL